MHSMMLAPIKATRPMPNVIGIKIRLMPKINDSCNINNAKGIENTAMPTSTACRLNRNI